MSLPLKGKDGRRTRPPSACMEPTLTEFANKNSQTQRDNIGYALPDRCPTDFQEVTKFGGEMMHSSITSLERALGTDAEGQSTSMNAYAYVTTAREVCQ